MKNKIGLINYEGDAIALVRKSESEYAIIDQWAKEILLCQTSGVIEFILGHFGVIDSKGRSWYFTKESEEARNSIVKIFEFLNI